MNSGLDARLDPIERVREKLEFAKGQRLMWDTEVKRFELYLEQKGAI